MQSYVIKNKESHPIILQFAGQNVHLKPGGMFIWQGPDESIAVLQRYVTMGLVNVWTIGVNAPSSTEESLPVCWQKEGF